MRVGILGFGLEGRSAVAALQRWGETSIVVLTDEVPSKQSAHIGVPWFHGRAALKAIRALDLLVKSPGIPPRHPLVCAAQMASIPLTTPTNLYLEKVRASGTSVIGVTGSKGKSTTATLV